MSPASSNSPRFFWIDWVRILATFLVALYHNLRFFDENLIDLALAKNERINHMTLSLFQWLMPLFFFLAGFSFFLAVKSKSLSFLLQERLVRLLIPGIIGTLTISPLERFISEYYRNDIPNFFQFWINFMTSSSFSLSQFWFLFSLFGISCLNLPFFLGYCGKQVSSLTWIAVPSMIFGFSLVYIYIFQIDPLALIVFILFYIFFSLSFFFGKKREKIDHIDLEEQRNVETVQDGDVPQGFLLISLLFISYMIVSVFSEKRSTNDAILVDFVILHNFTFLAGFFVAKYDIFNKISSSPKILLLIIISILFSSFVSPPLPGYFRSTLGNYNIRLSRILWGCGVWYWTWIICFMSFKFINSQIVSKAIFDYLRESSFAIFIFHNVTNYLVAAQFDRFQNMGVRWFVIHNTIFVRICAIFITTLILCNLAFLICRRVGVLRFLLGFK